MSRELRSGSAANNKFSKRAVRLLPLLLVAFMGACTKKAPSDAVEKSSGAAKAPREVSLAIWANYLTPEMQERFTKETGILLRVSNYSSSEELLAKLQSGAAGIDVAVPSDYMVGVMNKLGLLAPIDAAKIPNKADLDPTLLKREFDPENQVSLPYSWIVTGIAVNRDLYKGSIKGWKDLMANKEIAGKFSLLDDVREVTAAALRANGISVNTLSTADLAKAETTLKDVRNRVKMFTSDVIDPLVKKEVAVAQGYSSDVLQAAKATNGKVEFILPDDGGTRAIDSLVIVKGTKNFEAAHALINFLLSPEVNASFVKTIMGGPVNVKTKALLPAELKVNQFLFPSPSVLTKFEYIHDVGEATRAYDRLWTEVRAR
jgi:spermidine/putrescine transport system substrate-binding protein